MSAKVTNLAERPAKALVGAGVASIMVYVDFDSGCEARINIAADLAARCGAVLIGVAGWLPGREPGGWFAAELERPEDRLDRILAELEKLAERFRDVAHPTVRAVEWRGRPHFPREVIAAEARAADLVVIGSHTVAEDVYHAFDPGTFACREFRAPWAHGQDFSICDTYCASRVGVGHSGFLKNNPMQSSRTYRPRASAMRPPPISAPVANIRTSEHHVFYARALSVRMFGSWGKKRANASPKCGALSTCRCRR